MVAAPYSVERGTGLAATFVTGAIAKIWSVCETSKAALVLAPPDCCQYEVPMDLGLVQAEGAHNCLLKTCC
jgi:hypothetical protein